MKYAAFQAAYPFEIGDRIKTDITREMIRPDTGERIVVMEGIEVHTITDIACTHYLKTGMVVFKYELDHSGNYVKLYPICRNEAL